MTGHLCLKWNNHSSAFLKSISNIHIKERYCDATIACQGKYFPVHRVVLSTCSDYFDEMFERMQCQHPYIVFKDIEPREMELLLNYMYQGEVNVVQEMLPTLIKAAEALKVKGLAVPDDMPSNKDSSCGKKRTNTSNDNPQPKRRSEESRRRRRDSSELHTNSQTTENSDGSSLQNNEGRLIKEEPVDSGDYADGALDAAFGDGGLPGENPSASHDPDSKNEDVFGNFAAIPDEGAVFIKSEPAALVPHEDPYEEQSSSWSDFGSGSVLPNLPTSEVGGPDDMDEFGPAFAYPHSPQFETGRLSISLPCFSPLALSYLTGEVSDAAEIEISRTAVIDEIIHHFDVNNLLNTTQRSIQKPGYLMLHNKLNDDFPNCVKEKGTRQNKRLVRPLGDLVTRITAERRKLRSKNKRIGFEREFI